MNFPLARYFTVLILYVYGVDSYYALDFSKLIFKIDICWARPGFEPGTSRTLSENHTPRPTSQMKDCFLINTQIKVPFYHESPNNKRLIKRGRVSVLFNLQIFCVSYGWAICHMPKGAIFYSLYNSS